MVYQMTESCRQLWSVHCNDSIELAQQLTLSQDEKHIIAQPNIEPTLRHKFHQFYPFIQKQKYDNNSASPVIYTDCDAVAMTTFGRHIDFHNMYSDVTYYGNSYSTRQRIFSGPGLEIFICINRILTKLCH